MAPPIDLLDQKIIAELDLNCRSSASQLAKKVHAHRNVVVYRIQRLEQEGVITRYLCSLNLGLLGYKTYKLYLTVNPNPTIEKDFIKKIIAIPNVIHALRLEGAFDFSLALAVEKISELDLIIANIKNEFHDFVKDYEWSTVICSHVFKLHKLLLGKMRDQQKSVKYAGEADSLFIDDKDKKILRSISQEANKSLITLARETNLSLDIVKYRLKQWEKQGFVSYRLSLDPQKLEYTFYRLLLRIRKATQQDEAKLLSWCSLQRDVLYCTKQLGRYDFEINFALKGSIDLYEFLSKVRQEFSGVIDSYDLVMNRELLKINYVPF